MGTWPGGIGSWIVWFPNLGFSYYLGLFSICSTCPETPPQREPLVCMNKAQLSLLGCSTKPGSVWIGFFSPLSKIFYSQVYNRWGIALASVSNLLFEFFSRKLFSRSTPKEESSRKTSISSLLTMPKPLTVDHNKLWKILKEMGIPDHLTCLLRNLYAGQKATVRTGHGTTHWFQIGKGVP